jgi:endonuclease G, mitochondrial
MRTPEEKAALLRAFNNSLLDNDEELADAEAVNNESVPARLPPEEALDEESIVMRRRRPVLAIQSGAAVLEFSDRIDVPIWQARLEGAADVLKRAIAAVGRIELTGNPDFSWVGTGWLVHPGYLVTNRHVAEAFASRDGEKFVFQAGPAGDMTASIDMLQEIGRPDTQVFKINGVSYIEDRPGLDLAFLEVEQIDGQVATPIPLFTDAPPKAPVVAAIGYPAFDSRIPEPDLMRKIYGEVFDKKRLAPGVITDADEQRVLHNCTTLGGNSGSVLVHLDSGSALGLHFSGSFLRTNFAVRADRVKERLDALLAGTLGSKRETRSRVTVPRPVGASPDGQGRPSAQPTLSQPARGQSDAGGPTASITVPLVVTISLGDITSSALVATRNRPQVAPRPVTGSGEDGDAVEDEAKAKPEDYASRTGYAADFLGAKFTVGLPEIVRGKSEILTYDSGKHVLPYEHFSVVMHKGRRQCFFSACNIDGARSKSSKRTAWRFDPRIPETMQIMKECYGSPPKFSRGHMTRREDPAWGKAAAEIQRGADDSMHVTNATPQMQSFNAPIWLALEDYALQHAREDDQKISVFTGPYFTSSDPTMFGVRIPKKFWKVIVFIHDETRALCATGYEMSQEGNLEAPEFVFGNFVSPQLNMSTQVAISQIETRAGVSFDGLAEIDPFGNEAVGDVTVPLLHPGQIRFF